MLVARHAAGGTDRGSAMADRSAFRLSFQAMGKPFYAFGITVVRQLLLYIPMLLLFDHLWEFNGLICAQPVTEAIMMTVSVLLLRSVIRREERRYTDC